MSFKVTTILQRSQTEAISGYQPTTMQGDYRPVWSVLLGHE